MEKNDRFFLWIDAIGGYWVCLDNSLVLGRPDTNGGVDIPILGDLSKRHARICREGEDYLIEALQDVEVDGRSIHGMSELVDGSKIRLGRAVSLSFRRPHALSGTARLDFVSGHRTQPTVDAVLLMADTCILGPKPVSHVVCRNWSDEVIFYRRKDELFCRGSNPLEIDGRTCRNQGPVRLNSRVVGEQFTLSLEPIHTSGG